MTFGRPSATLLLVRVLLALGLVVAPLLQPAVVAAPAVTAPAPGPLPVQEEEEKGEEKAGEEADKSAPARDRRQPAPPSAPRLQPHHTPDPRSGLALTRPAPLDHLGNGLGTPIRC